MKIIYEDFIYKINGYYNYFSIDLPKKLNYFYIIIKFV